MQCKWTFTKCFALSHHKENDLLQLSQKLHFVGSKVLFSLILLFTQYKIAWLSPISTHCLAALPAVEAVCIQQQDATKCLLP